MFLSLLLHSFLLPRLIFIMLCPFGVCVFWKFLYFPVARRVVTAFASRRKQWLTLRSAPTVVLAFFSSWHTKFFSFYNCLPLPFHRPCIVRMVIFVSRGRGEQLMLNERAYGPDFSLILVYFLSVGSGWGHCPYDDCPAEQRAHRRSEGWYPLCGASPRQDRSGLRPLQQPSGLQHQPAKYVTLIRTSLWADILRYLWLNSNTTVIAPCISLWT